MVAVSLGCPLELVRVADTNTEVGGGHIGDRVVGWFVWGKHSALKLDQWETRSQEGDDL